MTSSETKIQPRFQGIIPPMVTPLMSRDELDVPGTKRLIEHLIAGGVSGVFVLGTTGEAQCLGYRLRRQLIQLVTETVGGRIPVLVGITDTAFVESEDLGRHAAAWGADALVLTTPYYFPVGQTELLGYTQRLLDRLILPVMLYNMPSMTKVWFEVPTLEELADDRRIVGVKDSSGDLDYFARVTALKEKRPDWSVLVGPESLLIESLERGGDGGVNGGANFFPELFVAWYRAWKAGDAAGVAVCQEQVDKLQAIYEIGKYDSRFIKATKSALGICEVCSDHMAEPFNHFLEPERQRVKAILDTIDLSKLPQSK
ncbi:dihydrodipicolinate synthase family protein [Rubinisphaera margarita]|uniref:dihydrodipicolinate synthase family protein n=1 Tax=Rubinisphaera margarita TaxID=2909586 RepID=UPI001EE91AD6|nr:dihydrodipicolinate synthase family protein [Rubinisphaera margarita]MCG6155733.1 dihydrodipicolinate synthase family protein [Rubinisphaera margarita]